VTVSGLDCPFFDKAVSAVQEIYGAFDRSFAPGSLGSWNLTDSNGLSLDASNHYFTPVRDSDHVEAVPFQADVDPRGILAKMSTAPGARIVHTEE
jgi:hypothetical protein